MNYNSILNIEDNYKGTFLRLKFIYEKYLKRKKSFDLIIDKKDENNLYVLKDALQNYYSFGVKEGYNMLCKDIEYYEKKLFNWLDEQDKPYFYIYYSHYEYNTYSNAYGIYHVEGTGVNEFSHHLAKQYALNKITWI